MVQAGQVPFSRPAASQLSSENAWSALRQGRQVCAPQSPAGGYPSRCVARLRPGAASWRDSRTPRDHPNLPEHLLHFLHCRVALFERRHQPLLILGQLQVAQLAGSRQARGAGQAMMGQISEAGLAAAGIPGAVAQAPLL